MSNEKIESTEKDLIKVSGQLRTLSLCVNAYFQAETEHDLLQSFCEVLVSGDDLSLAWVGYCESTSEFIKPVANAGVGVDYFERLPASGDADKSAMHPAAQALKSGKPCCINDVAADPRFSDWRTRAVEAGHASSLAIPLNAHGKRQGNIDLRGTLHLCSRVLGFFDESTSQYYEEVARYLTLAVAAFRTSLSEGLTSGVAALRAKQDRQKAQDKLRKMREELSRITRLGEMSQISASIAHEINQPLAAIVTHGSAGLRWLSHPAPDIDEARVALGRIVEDGMRASELVTGIRSMFEKGDQTKALQNVNEVVREVLTFVQDRIERHRIIVHTQLDENLPEILINRVQLQQVIINLVANAIEAMSSLQDRERLLVLGSQLVESRSIRVVVRDAGIGIDDEKIEQVFDPFFTTKPHGIGVGLAICRSIIESHAGSIQVERGDPHGSVFSFVIPIAENS